MLLEMNIQCSDAKPTTQQLFNNAQTVSERRVNIFILALFQIQFIP